MNYAIELNNVTKEYKVFPSPKQRLLYSLTRLKRFTPSIFTAVDGVDFKIEKGEILGIIGKNGAGKSTVLKLITGVSFPTHGNINVNGRISSLLELGAGFNPELTGMENIYFQANLLGITKDVIESRVPDILDFADIGDFIHQPVKNYSSGMFARLAFATAINVDPDILIVDEVLSVGDIAFQFKCIEKMKEFAKKGVTIIFVTHSMMSLYRFCNRAIWIEKGKIVMDGTVETVVPKYEDRIREQETDKREEKVHDVQADNEYVQYHSVQLIQNGEVVDNIKKRDPFQIKMKYTLCLDLEEQPYFSISILKDGFNKDHFGMMPMKDAYHLSSKAGTYEITLDMIDNYFNIGEYILYFSIMEQNGLGTLFFNEIKQFEILGTQDSLGMVDARHKIKVEKINE